MTHERLTTLVGAPPPRTFDQASQTVLDYLSDTVPMGAWAVTRIAAGRQTILAAADRTYGIVPGVEGLWETAMCRTMVSGQTPRVIPDTDAVPEVADAVRAAEALGVPVRAYVGTPIVQGRGNLFGTVVGLNQEPMREDLLAHEALLDLLSGLLSSVLEADTAATETARALESAVGDAETDQLTGLLNRRGWDRWLAREEERYQRFGDPAVVVAFDLDGLKAVNDTEGHDAGDRYLRRFADALRSATRHGDPVARLGGDEFGLIASVGVDEVEPLVARLRGVLDDAGVPCSIGVAPFNVAGGFTGAAAEADAAMYEDKRTRRAGRARVATVHLPRHSESPYVPDRTEPA
jgi:diguanylate cyclase (GGDEF)-like protein